MNGKGAATEKKGGIRVGVAPTKGQQLEHFHETWRNFMDQSIR
jgi:hypothetical protein